MATATFLTFMSTRGFLDAGVYKAEVKYTVPSNEEFLSNRVCDAVRAYGSECNGVLQTRTVTTPKPELLLYDETFAFVNRESCLTFTQNVGARKSTFALEFEVDFASLQALL